ncbi:hypothetical protein DTW90_18085 [Neorhizobium sp. P12A]|uniref:hypothetical protein n=1 Tax=Rhizobium/Agrobacterium group TaxID=227290 RepID=UPI001051E203|nr:MULTISPECIES: hypothetical protein [Rhizobium/Agrobacterium group]KAA0698027.1 hypothetical protein DTW90_18085 [Neorhizobium sp. P12A]TCR87725.1 hypothetical protein EV561_10570 [Rhizobium sp. BK376]
MAVLTQHQFSSSSWLRTVFGGVADTMGMVRAAQECSTARREHRNASPAALRTLGIDEMAFRQALKRR